MRADPYRLYLWVLSFSTGVLFALAYTTSIVFWVERGHLDALQLVLLGTVLEAVYFACQLPTGVLADAVSRRMCVIVGWFLCGLAMIEQGVSPAFGNLLVAQILLGVGIALVTGAEDAWIADELPKTEMTRVYVRASQFGIVAQVLGALGSGLLAAIDLHLPLIVSGAGMLAVSLVLLVFMPETPRPRAARSDAVGVVRAAWTTFHTSSRRTGRALAAVPGLVLLFGMIAFVGAWSESFDRLWGAFFLADIRFPGIGGLGPTTWFSILACVVALLSLGSTEIAKRRTERLGPGSVAGTLLAVVALIGVGSVLLGAAHSFAAAAGAYLLIEVMRPVSRPLTTGWLVTRVEPGLRATAFSAQDMFDAGGQTIGGPIVGVIGRVASLRAALWAGAAALAPAMALLAVATKRMKAHPEYADITPAGEELDAAPVA